MNGLKYVDKIGQPVLCKLLEEEEEEAVAAIILGAYVAKFGAAFNAGSTEEDIGAVNCKSKQPKCLVLLSRPSIIYACFYMCVRVKIRVVETICFNHDDQNLKQQSNLLLLLLLHKNVMRHWRGDNSTLDSVFF